MNPHEAARAAIRTHQKTRSHLSRLTEHGIQVFATGTFDDGLGVECVTNPHEDDPRRSP